MGSSALELVLIPILWGTFGGICGDRSSLRDARARGHRKEMQFCRHDQWRQQLGASVDPCPSSTLAQVVAMRSGHTDENLT